MTIGASIFDTELHNKKFSAVSTMTGMKSLGYIIVVESNTCCCLDVMMTTRMTKNHLRPPTILLKRFSATSLLFMVSCVNLIPDLCVFGTYGSQTFQVLIDIESTHNFVKPVLVEQLGLLMTPIRHFRVSPWIVVRLLPLCFRGSPSPWICLF